MTETPEQTLLRLRATIDNIDAALIFVLVSGAIPLLMSPPAMCVPHCMCACTM